MSRKTQFFVPRNWKKFQHYKDRKPPWIKLHIELLDDYDFGQLTDMQQLVLLKIWMLYAKLGKPIPNDTRWIGEELHINTRAIGKAIPALLSNNFIEIVEESASTPQAPSKQLGPPETYSEETELPPVVPLKVDPPPKPKSRKLKTRLPDGFTLTDEMRSYAIANGMPAGEVDGEFAGFKNHHRAHGSLMADWLAAWQTWCRNYRRFNRPAKAKTATGQSGYY